MSRFLFAVETAFLLTFINIFLYKINGVAVQKIINIIQLTDKINQLMREAKKSGRGNL